MEKKVVMTSKPNDKSKKTRTTGVIYPAVAATTNHPDINNGKLTRRKTELKTAFKKIFNIMFKKK